MIVQNIPTPIYKLLSHIYIKSFANMPFNYKK